MVIGLRATLLTPSTSFEQQGGGGGVRTVHAIDEEERVAAGFAEKKMFLSPVLSSVAFRSKG